MWLFSRESFKDTRIQDAIIETYLSYLEKRFIEIENLSKRFNNLTKGERNAMCSLKDDKTVIIKCGDKGVGVIVLERKDYLEEANTQLKDKEVYVEVSMTRLHL